MKNKFSLSILTMFLLLPSVSQSEALDDPAQGFARVYFFHFLAPLTGRYSVQLFADHSYIGLVDSSAAYGFDFEPGPHLLWAKAGNQKWFLKADLDADRTYFVHLLMSGGSFNPMLKPTLLPASQNTKKGKKTLKKIKSRLDKDKFEILRTLSADEVAGDTKSQTWTIEEVMRLWDSEWSDEKKWNTLAKDDYVK